MWNPLHYCRFRQKIVTCYYLKNWVVKCKFEKKEAVKCNMPKKEVVNCNLAFRKYLVFLSPSFNQRTLKFCFKWISFFSRKASSSNSIRDIRSLFLREPLQLTKTFFFLKKGFPLAIPSHKLPMTILRFLKKRTKDDQDSLTIAS